MRKILIAAAAAGLVTTPAQAADDSAPSVYEPSGPWQADFGEDYCRLARSFSDGEHELFLALERIQPGPMARLILIGDEFRLFRRATQLGYRYLPSGDDRMALLLRSETGDGQQYLNLGDIMMGPAFVPPEPGSPPTPPAPYTREGELDFAKDVTGIELDEGLLQSMQIDTGALKAPIEVLQACADDLLKYWGLDPEKHKTLTRPAFPASDATKWLPAGTLSFEDFGKLSGGANQIRLLLDEAGKPKSCDVHWPSLSENTNKAVCKALLEKAEYTPALDVSGQPMASYAMINAVFLFPPFGGT